MFEGFVLVALEDVGVVHMFLDGVGDGVMLANMTQVEIGFSCLIVAFNFGLLLDLISQSQQLHFFLLISFDLHFHLSLSVLLVGFDFSVPFHLNLKFLFFFLLELIPEHRPCELSLLLLPTLIVVLGSEEAMSRVVLPLDKDMLLETILLIEVSEVAFTTFQVA